MNEDMHEHTDHRTLRATFADEQGVHDAALALEQNGVDASDIALSEPDHVADTARIDTAVAGWMSRRFLLGGLTIAVAAGLVAFGAASLLGARWGVAVTVGVSIAVFGFWVGAYYGVATRLPFNTGTLESVAGKRNGPYWVEVSASPSDEGEVRDLLTDHGARDVSRTPVG